MSTDTNCMVEVFDFDTKEVKLMPAAEVGPGMIRAQIEGRDKEYWIQLAQIKGRANPSRHHALNEDDRANIRHVMNALKEVRPLSFKAWKNGFRKDRNPGNEIAIWLRIAETYTNVAKAHDLTLDQKQELFQVVLNCSSVPREKVLDVVTLDALPRETAAEAVEAFFTWAVPQSAASELPPEEYPDYFGDTPLPLSALTNPDVREDVKSCDVVSGVDSSTGNFALFYGAEKLKEIVSSGVAGTVPRMSFLYDSRTDELEYILAVVQVLKGSHCYGAGE